MRKMDLFHTNMLEHPPLQSPVFNIVLGTCHEHLASLMQLLRNSMGEAVQFLQIAEKDKKLSGNWYDFLESTDVDLETTLKTLIGEWMRKSKTLQYGKIGQVTVNLLFEQEFPIPNLVSNVVGWVLEELSKGYPNDVACHCVVLVEERFQVDHALKDLYERLSELKKANRIGMLYVLSDLDSTDRIRMDTNRYLCVALLVLTQCIQSGMKKGNVDFFHEQLSHGTCSPGSSCYVHSMGCLPLVLHDDLIRFYMQKYVMEYMQQMAERDHTLLQSLDTDRVPRQIIKESEEMVAMLVEEDFLKYYEESLNRLCSSAYNGNVNRFQLFGMEQRMCLQRLYTDNLEGYMQRNIQYEQIQQRLLNHQQELYKARFLQCVRDGRLNPSDMRTYHQLEEELAKKIELLEREKIELRGKKAVWERKRHDIRWMFWKKRMIYKMVKEWSEYEKKMILLQGQIRFYEMQRVSLQDMQLTGRDCAEALQTGIQEKTVLFENEKKAAKRPWREEFEALYGDLFKQLLQGMGNLEKRNLYRIISLYMLDPHGRHQYLNRELNRFMGKLREQSVFPKTFTEEIQQRLGGQRAFAWLQEELLDLFEINLRALQKPKQECAQQMLCLLGPKENALMQYLKKQEPNGGYQYCEVNWLKAPIVLYVELNIDQQWAKIGTEHG